MKARDLAVLFFLAGLWGSTALLNRIAAPEFGIPALIGTRLVIASTVLVGYARATRRMPDRGMWKPFVVLGVINTVLPLSLQAFAATQLPVSLTSVLTAPTPLFAALVARVWLKDPLTTGKLAGMLLGIAGVAVLVGLAPVTFTPAMVLGVLAALGSSFSYSVGTAYTKIGFVGVKPVPLTTGQILAGALLWLPVTAVTMPAVPPSNAAIAVVAIQGLLSTAIGYLLFFRLVEDIGPTKTLSVTLLIPCFGVLWGALILNESISLSTIIGLITVLISVLLVAEVLPLRRAALVES